MKIKILFISTLLTAVGIAGCTTTSSVDETDMESIDNVFSVCCAGRSAAGCGFFIRKRYGLSRR